MLSYQHIYHAGNFADVHKHAVLTSVLTALRLKPQPMAVLDTHAGRGLYALSGPEASRNREFDNGITPALQKKDGGLPPAYLEIVKKYQPDYPGTALIAREMLRPSDRLICAELHPGEFAELQKNLSRFSNAALHKKDGLKMLEETIPFSERRGLVVIDPSYEIKTEYDELPRHVFRSWKKWPQGVYFIWYPIMGAKGHIRLLGGFRKSGLRDVLLSEIRLEKPPQEDFRMQGSGLAIVNPPWPEARLRALTQSIAAALPGVESSMVNWLDNAAIND